MEKSLSENKIKEAAEKIGEEFHPEKIILFGSWAWGNPTKDSDADLFVVKSTDQPTRAVARAIDALLFPRPFPLDVIVHTPEQVERALARGDFFITAIVSRGKVLYAR